MPYEEEEDRVCEVKCPKGGGVCGIGSTPILLPKEKKGEINQHQLAARLFLLSPYFIRTSHVS